MNLIAIAKVAFEAGAIEDPTQLTEDAIALDGYYNKALNGWTQAQLTEADLDVLIPAISRTAIVLGQLWHDKTKHQDVLNALKGL